MVRSIIKEEIARQVDRLPIELQRRVLDFAQALVLSSTRGVPGKDLLRFAGTLDSKEAEAMVQAIAAGCE